MSRRWGWDEVAGCFPCWGRHILLDGYDLVIDLEASNGCYLIDGLTRKAYLDVFSFFGSSPFGINHPRLRDDPLWLAEPGRTAVDKSSNSDVYTRQYAEFVETFHRVLGDPQLPWLFFIEGGALAVENALKAAFDWRAQHDSMVEGDGSPPLVAMHLSGAFHGRSGYTLSLTNTDRRKTDLFPKFNWPRITTPVIRFPEDLADPTEFAWAEDKALTEAAAAFADPRWRVACFVAEPIQGEGGDRHMLAEFLRGDGAAML